MPNTSELARIEEEEAEAHYHELKKKGFPELFCRAMQKMYLRSVKCLDRRRALGIPSGIYDKDGEYRKLG